MSHPFDANPDHLQSSLFSEQEQGLPNPKGQPLTRSIRSTQSELPLPAALDDSHQQIARDMSPLIRLGTSSWNFPGWVHLIWKNHYAETSLSRHGLRAYAQHPLMRCVSVDKSFYRPLKEDEYVRMADQVDDGFRFVVKAPSVVTDITFDMSLRNTTSEPGLRRRR